ncbi:MAG TPA: rRNA pseudouridine synthase [Firmicutes bacterium]|nr:rRNA pseudouridine synthase [Bacillota bacterium]
MRLQKALAEAGVASRRAAEDLIRQGRVSVNGRVVTELGTKVDPAADRLAVDGEPVVWGKPFTYVMLNKPAGYLTTAWDPQGRPTVLQLVEGVGLRVFPVGRLDADTEGLLLFTNDGELAHRLLHPRYHVPKTYLAEVEGVPGEDALARLRAGVELEDGAAAPAAVSLVRAGRGSGVVELTITEGRKRQVKRMLAAVGHPVRFLRRVAFGPLTLGRLQVGAWRELNREEIEALRRAAGLGRHNLPDGDSD